MKSEFYLAWLFLLRPTAETKFVNSAWRKPGSSRPRSLAKSIACFLREKKHFRTIGLQVCFRTKDTTPTDYDYETEKIQSKIRSVTCFLVEPWCRLARQNSFCCPWSHNKQGLVQFCIACWKIFNNNGFRDADILCNFFALYNRRLQNATQFDEPLCHLIGTLCQKLFPAIGGLLWQVLENIYDSFPSSRSFVSHKIPQRNQLRHPCPQTRYLSASRNEVAQEKNILVTMTDCLPIT